jgi:radical SAM-linked protein
LSELAKVAGVYVPAYGTAKVVRRRLVADIDQVPPPTCPVLPCSETIHERFTVEIQRGCTRGCRFCQAGMINRPVRQRSAPSILDIVAEGLKRTGYGQVSFLSLSAGDHPRILQILEGFYNSHAARRISASLPSLRAETLTPKLIDLVKTVRKSGFTIAPEAGSDRLRRVINKPLTDDDVIQAARGAFAAGWRLIKLYFMVGLPTETPGDRDAIVELVARLLKELKSDGHRPRINVGLSTFVPKPHTPFQWERMVSLDEASAMLGELRRKLKHLSGVKVGWTRPEMSWAEGLLSRGDRRLFDGLVELLADGRCLQGWSEHFDLERFQRSFADLNLLRERPLDAPLPWDHLDMGPTKEFLLAERERAYRETPTEDCTGGACEDCGACDEEDAAVRLDDTAYAAPFATEHPPEGDRLCIRLTLAKRGRWRHLSHIEFMLALRRALRRAGWPLRHTQGFHPKPKISFGPACPVGVESYAEQADVSLAGPIDPEELARALRSNLPAKMDLLSAEVLPPNAPSIMARGVVARYRFMLQDRISKQEAESGVRALLEKGEWVVSRMTKGKHRNVDVRASLRSLDILAEADGLKAVCELVLDSKSAARPAEVAQEAFGLTHIPTVREAVFVQPEGT